MKTLYDVISEAREETIGEMRNRLQAVRTSIPKPIALVRQSFLDNSEYELYEFIQFCEWWMVKNKNAEGWPRTAGVRVANEKVEFYYDKNFIESIAKRPGMLMFLIAHEASHIFRLHQDRQESTNRDSKLWNIATDMIINKDIMDTKKISSWAPEWITNEFNGYSEEDIKNMEKNTGKSWDELKKKIPVMQIPKEYNEMVKKKGDSIKMPYTSDKMYEYLIKHSKQQKQQKGKGKEEKKDYFAPGTIVKVNSGEHEGEYRKIVKKNKDGTFTTVPVDIQSEIRKVEQG